MIDHLKLRNPIYRKTAAFGHFGRTEPEFSWELTDKAETPILYEKTHRPQINERKLHIFEG